MGKDQQATRLLQALTEQLKMPLLQIAYHAELGQKDALEQVGITAERALGLVDNYLLATTIGQQQLAFEPVSISSILYEVAEELTPMAKQYNCELELHVEGRYEPVMANQAGLRAALVSLGQSFIEAGPEGRPTVILASYKNRKGITAGLFSKHTEQTANMLRRALRMYRLPVATGPGVEANAGIYIAENLLRAMSTKLYVAKHRNINGLAASFMSSAQLELV